MQGVGAKLLASLVDSENGVDEFMKLGLSPDMFIGVESDVFGYIETHLEKYGTIPTRETITNETSEDLPISEEPPKYYAEHVEKRYIQKALKKGFLEAQNHLQQKDPVQALELVVDLATRLTLHKNRKEIVNFTEDAYGIMHNYLTDKWLGKETYGIMSGWPYLDDMTQGFMGGDVVVLAGRPASGKTYKTLYMARNAWMQGKRPLVVSMEMKPLPLIQRLTALHTNIPAKHFKSGDLSTNWKNKTFNTLKDIKTGYPPFWIIDGNLTASVRDISLLAHQLQPDVIYVDGAYLLKHHERVAKWERVSATVEDLKQAVASNLDIPCVASYQFNREQTKMKHGETGVEHIAGADAIGQIASIVLGFFDDETPESILRQHVDVLKGRNGEVGGFDINWRFEHYPYMDFSQIPDEKPEDLKFI